MYQITQIAGRMNGKKTAENRYIPIGIVVELIGIDPKTLRSYEHI